MQPKFEAFPRHEARVKAIPTAWPRLLWDSGRDSVAQVRTLVAQGRLSFADSFPCEAEGATIELSHLLLHEQVQVLLGHLVSHKGVYLCRVLNLHLVVIGFFQ